MTASGNFVKPDYTSRIEWVDVDKVEVSIKVQREFRVEWAAKIAKNFDPNLIGKPVVWADERNGKVKFRVLDGQHRIHAAREVLGGGQKIECEVVRGITEAEAAKIFLGRNVTKMVRAVDKFRVGLTARDPECLAIRDVLDGLHLKIAAGPTSGHVGAVVRVIEIYRQDPTAGASGLLHRTLSVCIAAWGRDPGAFAGDVMVGIAAVIHRHDKDVDARALGRRLAATAGGPDGLIGRARGLRHSLGWPIRDAMAAVIVGLYNRGRRTAPLAEWAVRNKVDTKAATAT